MESCLCSALEPPVGFCCPSRYGERSSPFCVSVVDARRRGDGEFSRRIHDAVERASLDIPSGSSSDEEDEDDGDKTTSSCSLSEIFPAPAPPTSTEPKTIPTVSNPNSVYRVGGPESDRTPSISVPSNVKVYANGLEEAEGRRFHRRTW